MTGVVRSILGLDETGPYRVPDDIEPREGPPPAPTTPNDDIDDFGVEQQGSGIQALISNWRAGHHMEAAKMVLSGLPSYTDLVRLIFALGNEGAIELASLMDELSERGTGGEEQEAPEDQVPLENPPLE